MSSSGESRTFGPSGALRGSLRPPADKSISHRAAILGALSPGATSVTNFLDSADTRATLAAVGRLGASVTGDVRAGGDLVIGGVGADGPELSASLDVGNAGTLIRLMPGWLAGFPGGRWTFDGDDSIRRRPIDRIAEPLGLMGARVSATDDRFPPFVLEGAELRGITYELPVSSAQVKSCLLLAGLRASGTTMVVEPEPTRDHTERMLIAAGADVDRAGSSVSVDGGSEPVLEAVSIPGDFSSAAFPLVAAVLVPDSEIRLEGVGLNPTRTGLLPILDRMGARIEVEAGEELAGEPRGNLLVRHSGLVGTEVSGSEIPLAIDELPLVALLAGFAEGETVIRDARELRAKESDRIATVAAALTSIGITVKTTEDGMVVTGGGAPPPGGTVDSAGDHRIAMMGAVAGLASRGGVTVVGIEAAAVSYPGFADDLSSLLDH